MISNKVLLVRSKNVQKFAKDVNRLITTTSIKTNSDILTKTERNHQQQQNNNNKWLRLRKHESARILSTIPKSVDVEVHPSTKVEAEDFLKFFPQLVDEISADEEYDDEPAVRDSLRKLLNYTVPTGKKNRGLAVITSYKLLQKNNDISEEQQKLVNVLGWCVEMLHSSFLSREDILNDTKFRRGVQSWHKSTELNAPISDVSLLQNAVFNLMQKHLNQHPYYVALNNLYHYTILKTAMGQALDALTQKDGKPNLDFFTMNTYNAIVKYKMAYYSFYLPVGSAMYLASNADPELHRQAKTILLEMGHFYRVQEDFLDCFGDSSITGHLGNDIKEGRCSWLAVVALQRMSPYQKEIFENNYGKNDAIAEAEVKKLYQDLGLPNTYTMYEEKSYNIIRHHIQQLSAGLPHDLFFNFMEKLYRRDCELFLF